MTSAPRRSELGGRCTTKEMACRWSRQGLHHLFCVVGVQRSEEEWAGWQARAGADTAFTLRFHCLRGSDTAFALRGPTGECVPPFKPLSVCRAGWGRCRRGRRGSLTHSCSRPARSTWKVRGARAGRSAGPASDLSRRFNRDGERASAD